VQLVALTHDLLGDPFWEPFVAGLFESGRDARCVVRHLRPETYSIDALLQLTRQAIAMQPDGLITTLPAPEQQHGLLRDAIQGGLAVGVLNTFDRRPVGERLATVFRVGGDDYAGGRIAADHLIALGAAGPSLVLDHYRVRNSCHAARIEGFVTRMAELGWAAEILALDTLEANVERQIEAALNRRTFASALTLGPPGFDLLSASIKIYKTPPPHVTFDVTPTSLDALGANELAGIIDCQPYLQGYLGVVLMAQHLRRNCSPIADVLTGPRLLRAESASFSPQVFD
jgi:simple sugar transport system substrate-binding protein